MQVVDGKLKILLIALIERRIQPITAEQAVIAPTAFYSLVTATESDHIVAVVSFEH
ncbi:hypothetical protein D9M68_907800 [compost metagenome]